jgi:hypothetical protein
MDEDGCVSAIRSAASRLSHINEKLGFSKFSVTQFLVALGLFIFITPFIEQPPYGDEIEGVVLTLVLLLGAMAVGGRRPILVLAMTLSAIAITVKWIHHFWPEVLPGFLVPALSLIFMVLLIYEFTRFILRSQTIDREVVSAAISTYVCLGLVWMFAYLIVSQSQPESFAEYGRAMETLSPYDAFYFSYATLVTVGYGDITPLSRVAKMLAILEGMTGMFYVVTIISRLVAMYGTTRPARQ